MNVRGLLLLVLLVLPLAALGQQGTVIYEETTQLDFELPPEMERFRDRMPSERRSRSALYFEGPVSLMRNLPEKQSEVDEYDEDRGRRFRMSVSQTESETFVDRSENVFVEQRTFLQRTFLITDELTPVPWRLTDERAEYLGYVAHKAVADVDEETTVEAWFTPQIPVQVGPGRYGGLPGLILVLTENDGSRSFVAQEVSLDEVDEPLARPSRGREVTREEFDAIVEERMGEMSGSGRVIQFRTQ